MAVVTALACLAVVTALTFLAAGQRLYNLDCVAVTHLEFDWKQRYVSEPLVPRHSGRAVIDSRRIRRVNIGAVRNSAITWSC